MEIDPAASYLSRGHVLLTIAHFGRNVWLISSTIYTYWLDSNPHRKDSLDFRGIRPDGAIVMHDMSPSPAPLST